MAVFSVRRCPRIRAFSCLRCVTDENCKVGLKTSYDSLLTSCSLSLVRRLDTILFEQTLSHVVSSCEYTV
jgi:hypothetical protein